jgi:hypothetical protein
MLGTYEDLSMLQHYCEKISVDSPESVDMTTTSLEKRTKQIQGQPLLPKHEKEQEELPFEEYQPPEEDVKVDEDEIVVMTFTISPHICSVRGFLIGPPQHNMQNADYMTLIPENTNTICALHDRNISITGTPNAVQLAYNQFSIIQKTYVSILTGSYLVSKKKRVFE